jgi:TniQ
VTSSDKRTQVQPRFDSWNLSPCRLLPRSLLYALEPIGIGTAFVESLSSYVARLAEAHLVSVGDLVGLVLSDVPNLKGAVLSPAAKASRRGGHGFRVCSYTVNGVTARPITLVQALEAATGRHDLQYLTVFPFRHALPDHLFHRHRAWCSLCYEDWRLNSQTVYEPLLWAIKTTSHCLVHKRPLRHDCPHCGRLLNALGVFSRPGDCERCGGWLGVPDVDGGQSPPADENQAWTSTQMGSLLAMLPVIDPMTIRQSLHRAFKIYLEEVAGGNILAFTEHIGCPGPMLHCWIAGTAVPRIENLLRIARHLNVPLASFFAPAGPTSADIAAARQAVSSCSTHRLSSSQRRSEIRRALLAALDAAVPSTVIAIARRLGYTTTDSLYRDERALCYKITARYRRSKKPGTPKPNKDQARDLLERSLDSTDPTSVHRIAASLGQPSDKYVHQDFPELCTAITQKIAKLKQDRSEKMRCVLENALGEEPVPPLADLGRRLGYPHTAVLWRHHPDLCRWLRVRSQAAVAKHRTDLERTATAVLEEVPVPSLRVVCRRLDITARYMGVHFPALARRIVEEHRRSVSAETAKRRALLLRRIPDIAAELHRQGLYPSVERILEHLPERSRGDWKTITFTVREAHKSLGIRR